ncbi:Vps38p NDAI_0J01960 [Naumovozyma dairenensis CBS 421]|uniref:Uncharacterized protein n=1 Tax=Naumovozyma dairenensis (strain ATCC 10597 / BCRC 20456 / CBS 421 / NBRC 0211 / NRRL Y-12639) TaxID=1071378 RepID=G0WH10_NAUDC|nr:hypothetical protein NDAI_0J01960 [Naumovozyma dairenensis CBS 421]CCD27088.1 hypothetical protein NDAI_0J01960 [Naumovozyma dairenensis CBS 421]
MPQYVSQRRLRHIRSISIRNLSLLSLEHPLRESFPYLTLPCFFVIKTLKGDTIYISETQNGSTYNVQFNSLPINSNPSTCVTVQLIVEISCKLFKTSGRDNEGENHENVWCPMATYEVDLNLLKKIELDNTIIESWNTPIFEFEDGIYIIPDTKNKNILLQQNTQSHRRKISGTQTKKSVTFNSLLKLNKMIEYNMNMDRELLSDSVNLEKSVRLPNGRLCWRKIQIIDAINQSKTSNLKKMNIIERLRSLLFKENALLKKSVTELSLLSLNQNQSSKEDYGNTYSGLIQTKTHLERIKVKKITQLIRIFENTGIFDEEFGFIRCLKTNNDHEPQSFSSSSPYPKITLNRVDMKRLSSRISKSQEDREIISSMLGYYLLFIKLITSKIYKIALPYNLQYFGSTSLIDGKYPLYCPKSNDMDQYRDFKNALNHFNVDISQTIQYLDHYYI